MDARIVDSEEPAFEVMAPSGAAATPLVFASPHSGDRYPDDMATRADLSPLSGPQAQALMLKLAQYPGMLTAAAQDFAPHDVTFYLRELAASYHSYYDAERILVDDETVRRARLALVAATAQVLHNGLEMLGVSAPAKM